MPLSVGVCRSTLLNLLSDCGLRLVRFLGLTVIGLDLAEGMCHRRNHQPYHQMPNPAWFVCCDSRSRRQNVGGLDKGQASRNRPRFALGTLSNPPRDNLVQVYPGGQL